MDHDVGGQQPQRREPLGRSASDLYGVAAAVDGDGVAVLAVVPRLERHRRLGTLERRGQGSYVWFVRETRVWSGCRPGAGLRSGRGRRLVRR